MSVLHNYKVCFLGRTGNGKSTLINALYGTTFNTDPLISCTKELYTVTLMNNCPEDYDSITIYDTPGIGEFSTNERYRLFYEEAISESDCIVLVSTFDRTDAPAQRLLLNLRPLMKGNPRFIIALNHIDSSIIAADERYVPWNHEANIPTKECLQFIQQRTDILTARFSDILNISAIIPVCGIYDYGIKDLKQCITNNK